MGVFVTVFIIFTTLFLMTQTFISAERKLSVKMLKHTERVDVKIPAKKISTSDIKETEEAEKLLIRTCQLGQALIRNCKQCYFLNGAGAICNLPTDAFCQGAKAINMHDVAFFWEFLPNPNGDFSEFSTAPVFDIALLTDVNNLDEALRSEIRNVYDFVNFPNFKYIKPSIATASDACGFSSLISN